MRSAIASAAAVIIVIVIIAVAGAGTYYVLNLPKQAAPTTTTNTSSSTTNSTSTITTTNSTTTSSSTNSTTTKNTTSTSLTTSTSTGFNSSSVSNPELQLVNLFGNFSGMTITDNVSESNSSVYVVLSYNVTGRTPLPNGSDDYQVNFTSHSYLEGKSASNSSAIYYYLSNGTVSAVYMDNHNYTGLFALSFSFQYDLLLTDLVSFGGNSSFLNDTALSNFQVGAPVNETIGSVVMNVTTYNIAVPSNVTSTATKAGTTTTTTGNTTTTAILKIGRIESNGKLVTSLLVYEDYGGSIIIKITNLTLAHYS